MASQIHVVSVERIAQEFHKMLPHSSRVNGMRLLRESGLLKEILPECERMIGVIQQKPAYPDADVWEHTLRVLELLPGKPGFTLTMGTLLHDVGKPDAMVNDNGRITFYHHESIGRELANRICLRWKLSSAEIRRICWLVEYHQYLGKAMQMKESKIKKILSEPGVEELLDLHEADALASTGDKSQIDYCRFYLKDQPQGPINPPLLLTGHDLARLGLNPGPIYKIVLDYVRDAQLDRRIQNKSQATDLAIEFLKDNKTLYDNMNE
jgi:poly(A) polymerase